MKRKIFAMMLAITMMASGIPGAAWADEADNEDVSVEVFDEMEAVGGDSVTIVESGECGENATYTLDSEGTLVISGSGEMWNYEEIGSVSVSPPFEDFAVKNAVIGNGITSIGVRAFSNCRDLTSVTISESVISIDDEAFSGCSGLTSVTIPKSVTSIGYEVFANCNKLTHIDVDELNEEYKSFEGVLFDKKQERILQYPRGKAGPYQIPKSVTSISLNAFRGCSGLTDVNIPKIMPERFLCLQIRSRQ